VLLVESSQFVVQGCLALLNVPTFRGDGFHSQVSC
jgi:hypothetical protein